jgi:hypothetical protein
MAVFAVAGLSGVSSQIVQPDCLSLFADETVCHGASGKGLSGVSRHLKESARTVVGEGFFQICDGGDLAIADWHGI